MPSHNLLSHNQHIAWYATSGPGSHVSTLWLTHHSILIRLLLVSEDILAIHEFLHLLSWAAEERCEDPFFPAQWSFSWVLSVSYGWRQLG